VFLRYTPSVFFSHSKHDRNLIDYFSKIFAFIGLRGIFFEWQQLPHNYAGLTISEYIRDPDTVAVFVLMGINVLRPPTRTPQYTHNWVSFEVGTASGCMKPIWVFEQFGSFIPYPIPLVTDYAQYTLENLQHLQYYGAIFQDRILYQTQRISPPTRFQCEYEDCCAVYNCWSIAESFNCPVCRRIIPKPKQASGKPFYFPSNVV
jgi:hypothetical protein